MQPKEGQKVEGQTHLAMMAAKIASYLLYLHDFGTARQSSVAFTCLTNKGQLQWDQSICSCNKTHKLSFQD